MKAEDYKEKQKRINKMHDNDWKKAINTLLNFQYDDNYMYRVIYKKANQKKERGFSFQLVKYVKETKSFIFYNFIKDNNTGELTEKVNDKLTLKDIEIISIFIEEDTWKNADLSDF